ncbi:MAG TPA: hypothetical protein VGK43_06560 [Solirubrobacterales bacterium]
MTSPPINLGTSGLTLGVRVYFQEAGEAPEAQGVGGVTVNEIGVTADYYLEGLPEPEQGVKAWAILYLPAAPAEALYTIEYGSVPGSSLVWRHEVQLASPTQFLVEGDTFGSLALVIVAGLPEEIGDGGTAATFSLWNVATQALAINAEPATISNVTEDGGGNGYGCTLTYTIQAGDTDTPGAFRGRFSIDYVGSLGIQTVPADDSMRVEIVPSYA